MIMIMVMTSIVEKIDDDDDQTDFSPGECPNK